MDVSLQARPRPLSLLRFLLPVPISRFSSVCLLQSISICLWVSTCSALFARLQYVGFLMRFVCFLLNDALYLVRVLLMDKLGAIVGPHLSLYYINYYTLCMECIITGAE